MNPKRALLALRIVMWPAALAPAAWLAAGFALGWLGANPIEKLTRVTGMSALVLLLVTLAVTPLRRVTGWNVLIKLRRPLGLFAYFYGVLHFTIWFAFDSLFDIGYMLEDIAQRRYITVGMAALVVLTPLAITSTRGWIRRLGKRWGKLHQGVYIATGLGVLHYFWLVKADTRLPLIMAAILAALLVFRHPRLKKKRPPKRTTPQETVSA
jgi:sulfoxide reductase heme-binding subunit YedZ